VVHRIDLGTRLLDNPVQVARYPADVYAFAALADPADPAVWTDLHTLVGPATAVRVKAVESVPDGWDVVGGGRGVQLVGTHLRAGPAPEAVRLGPDDVPEILDLLARTRPGPLLARTVQLGTYLGIRHRGRLIGLAGERLHLPGRTEISAVCTDPALPHSRLRSSGGPPPAGAWAPAWCGPSRPASGNAGRPRSCTPPRTTRPRSGCTSRSASPCAAVRPSFRCARREQPHGTVCCDA
jgi:hypothetical protein